MPKNSIVMSLEKATELFGDGEIGRRGQLKGSTGKAKDRLDREHQETAGSMTAAKGQAWKGSANRSTLVYV